MNKDLSKIMDINEYLDILNQIKNNVLIIVAVKDNAGHFLDEKIQDGLRKIGLTQSLIHEGMVGYVAVINNGMVICEQKSPKDGTEEYSGTVDGKKIFLLSKPYLSGNTSSIQIDGIEYSNNARGLNFVVYDNLSKQVIDRVSFDTHVKEYSCIHAHDIGVVGVWFGANYGSLLNGYATYCILKNLGKSVLMIQKPGADENDGEIHNTHNARFIEKFYPSLDVSKLYSFENMSELNRLCDTFIAGSDQIWHWNQLNYFKYSMLLNFVEDGKRKISFASSFGHSKDFTPKEYKGEVKQLLSRFNAISVREKSAEDICLKEYGIDAQTVIDPVFCIGETGLNKIAEESEMIIPERYLLAYILDPSDQKNQFLKMAEEYLNLPLYIIPDGFPWKYKRNKEKLPFENVMTGIGAEDVVAFFRDAEFIITDSYHGTCFSIIFNKPFISIANRIRGYARFVDILGRLGLEKRLIYDKDLNDDFRFEDYLSNIDYQTINSLVKEEVLRSIMWLKKALLTTETGRRRELPKLAEKDCTGCGACYNACPTNSILLEANREGFLKARIEASSCIRCGKCEKVCPVLHPVYRNNKEPQCMAVMAEDDIRFVSSSGGVFTLLSNSIIKRKGMICGAAFTDEFDVKHKCIEDENKLYILRGSKYYQSDIGETFRKIKHILDENRPVLFTGLPCQVAGLYGFLGKEYVQLYTVDLFCHGISSKKVFDKYLKDVHGEKKLLDLKFKAKEPWGWHAGINADFDDGSHYASPSERDSFYVSYLSSISKNNTCASCKFNCLPRQGDLTIGDFWGINAYSKELNDGKGTSAVLINNERGRELIQMIHSEAKMISEVPLKFAVSGNHIIEHPYPANRNREMFFQFFDTTNFEDLVKGAKTNAVYEAYYKSVTHTVSEEWLGLYELANTVVKKANGRKIVTWIRSAIFEEALEKFYNVKVAFGVSLRREACDEKRIRYFDVLNGKSNEYFVVSIDRAYDMESFNKLKSFGYEENIDYIYTRPKHTVFDGFNLKSGPYSDYNGNTIEGYDGKIGYIEFRGRNNHITFGKDIRNPENIRIVMHGDAYLTVGDNFFAQEKIAFEFFKSAWGGGRVVIGDNVRMRGGLTRTFSSHPLCEIHVGDQTTFETNPELHANAGKKVYIGRDCMFSHDVNVWAGDGHSIFDVNTGKNTNSIFNNQTQQQNNLIVGNHVWVAKGAFLLHGTNIGDGSIVGAMSVVKGKFPNNCVIAGNPASQVKKDAAWSRDIATEDIGRCGWEFVRKTQVEDSDGRKVLILGGTGRMSARLAELCIRNGDDVTLANRGKHGFAPVTYPAKKLIFDRFDEEETRNKLSGTKWDVIFDCSCYAPQCMEYLLSCVEVDRYIYVSSFATYVHTRKAGINVKESDIPLTGVQCEKFTDPKDYGLGKYQSEVFLANNYSDLNYAIVRIPFVMSAEDDYGDAVASRIGIYVDAVVNQKKINSQNLDSRYNFVESKDEAEFLHFLADNSFKGVVNFASRGNVSMREVISYVEQLTGKKAIYDADEKPYPFTNHPEITMDLTKCLSLGYEPRKLSDWLNGGVKDKIHRYIHHYMD